MQEDVNEFQNCKEIRSLKQNKWNENGKQKKTVDQPAGKICYKMKKLEKQI